MSFYNITDERKRREHRGEGTGADYKPWIMVREVPSTGTGSIIVDWKNGRIHQFLSKGESYLFYLLYWNDDVVDIREQYPLDLGETRRLAETFGIMHPEKGGKPCVMTTDMLVTIRNGDNLQYKAYSVKPDRGSLELDRNIEKLTIEKNYWNLHNIPFVMVFKSDLCREKVLNIKNCVDYYNIADVKTQTDLIKHLLARKIISADMTQTLDYQAMIQQYLGTEDARNTLIEKIRKEEGNINTPILQ